MKKLLPIGVFLILAFVAFKFTTQKEHQDINDDKTDNKAITFPKQAKKTPEQRALYTEERARYEFELQANPATGEIPQAEKVREFSNAKKAKTRIEGSDNLRAPDATFINRGPTNLGGRTRALVVDVSDVTGNTIIAGGVSGGVFRTTNGGASWTKVSANDEIHNVTAIAQDPTNTSVWYYSTGEGYGNSASLGAFYLGQGIWKSTNGGMTWTQMPSTASTQESFNSRFDIVFNLAVHPITGELYAAIAGRVSRFNGVTWVTEVTDPAAGWSTNYATDVVITSGGRTYASFSGNQDSTIEGIWTSSTGNKATGTWSRISNTTIHNRIVGRVVLGLAPSNEDKLYVLYVNGVSSSCGGLEAPEADLFLWDQSTTTWTDYSSKLPNEPGCSNGNDPLNVQGGYDLVVSVKPNDENFVVIGGTNAYKMADITDATPGAMFTRIGGYLDTTGYSLYNTAGGVEHHPDIHALVFNPFNNNILFSGTDGGIHKTDDVTAGTVDWTSLNNNYQTQQFYHVAIDPLSGSDIVTGGLQDNGTNYGGTDYGAPDLTTQTRFFSGDGVAVGISRDNACIPLFCGAQGGTFYRWCSGWTNIEPTGSSSQFVTYFHLDPDNNKNLYYAGKGKLWRTIDATNVTAGTWTDMGFASGFGTLNSQEWITRFSTTWGTYNAATSYLLIGGDSGSVFRLDDPQNAASASSAVNITPSGASGVVTGLAIHPSNRDIVLLTYSNYGITNIYLTTDATDANPTWTVVEQNLSAHSIRSAAITEVSGETMYLVGTARGLYSTADPTQPNAWTREAPNLIGYALVSSLAYRPADNKLLIGTHGNGMFEATITQVLGLEDNEISKSIKVYPNPVEDRLNLNMPAELSNNASFVINNILGQNVMRGSLENNQVNVNNLDTGMYFIQISSNGKKGVKRFIKK
tara:strand:+ start:3946 stop:6693 length:2748 start_codon:yes stop_codon:yes gene_type:complete